MIGTSLAVIVAAVALLLGVRVRPDAAASAASSTLQPPDGSVLVSKIAFGSCTSKVSHTLSYESTPTHRQYCQQL